MPSENAFLRDMPDDLQQWLGDAGWANVAVVFTDIIDSARLNNQLGDRKWGEVREAHFAQARRLIVCRSARQIRTEGDAIMAAFLNSVSALSFALKLSSDTGDPLVKIRAGIHVGQVQLGDGDFFGRHVNMAARVASKAAKGGVWVSGRVKEDVEDYDPNHMLIWEEHPAQELKGFDNPVTLWSVEGAAPGLFSVAEEEYGQKPSGAGDVDQKFESWTPRRDGSGGGSSLALMEPGFIELRIDRPFESYSDGDQERLLTAIKELLRIRGNIQVVSRKMGSVRVLLVLPYEKVRYVKEAVEAGRFANHGVVAATVIPSPEGGVRGSGLQMVLPSPGEEAIGKLRERGLRPWVPNYDVSVIGAELIVLVELAGGRSTDLEITVQGGRLTVSGVRRRPGDAVVAGGESVMTNINFGKFELVLKIPTTHDPSSAKAAYLNGFLSITVPVVKQVSPAGHVGIRQISVQVAK